MIISPKDLYVLYLRLHKSHGWNSVLTFSQRCDASLLAEIQSWQKGLNMNFPFGCAIAHILHLPLAFSWGFHNAMCSECNACPMAHHRTEDAVSTGGKEHRKRYIPPPLACKNVYESVSRTLHQRYINNIPMAKVNYVNKNNNIYIYL